MKISQEFADFRYIESLCRRAGCPREMLRAICVKELVDNALDASEGVPCDLSKDDDGTYIIHNEGCSLPESPAEIAALFSIGRPRMSSKTGRLPSRGALGNGLRVVAGCVLVSDGRLAVTCHGVRHRLKPQDDGTTTILDSTPAPDVRGTRIELWLSEAIPEDENDTRWGDKANDLATGGAFYKGRTSPYFFDDGAFFEYVRSSTGSVRDVLSQLDGCTGARAGQIAADYKGKPASDISRTEASAILAAARALAKPVKPSRLGMIGPDNHTLPSAYSRCEGTLTLPPAQGTHSAIIPFRVEVWAQKKASGEGEITCVVNRTPVAAELNLSTAAKHGTGPAASWVFDCNLGYAIPETGKSAFSIVLHVSTPFMPITSDGKEPNLEHFWPQIQKAATKAVRIAKRLGITDRPGETKMKLKECILKNLSAGISHASGNGQHSFNQRQLLYSVRPFILRECGGIQPSWSWWCKVITEIEGVDNTIPNMTRDARGSVYIPHEGIEIPLGTIGVQNYRHKRYTFSNILYCEKEGLVNVLRSERWPERRDCAIMTAKGFASRAARDLLDIIGETEDEITFFCIHDADSSGTLIYEKLQYGTATRSERRVRIINLGLEPWDAMKMGVIVESFKAGNSRRPVAKYVLGRAEQRPSEPDWPDWLQTNRAELNAMNTPMFIKWLDDAMDKHGAGKVVPPAAVLNDSLSRTIAAEVERQLIEEAAKKANVTARAAEIVAAMRPKLQEMNGELTKKVRAGLKKTPGDSWRNPLGKIAASMAQKAVRERGAA